VTYDDIYYSILFFASIYACGQIASRLLKMPSLVGEIAAGIILGPPLADIVPIPQAFVLLGEIGLILLVIEAGIDIDLGTLKLIGGRGVVIAILGSIFPIGIGVILAFILGIDTKGAIAAGASFGPTSLGIALNILRSGGILNTPVGQLIVSAAVIDDMIALVVLSQLRALTGDVTIGGILIPIVSALGFLVVGGYLAINVLPPLISKYILTRFAPEYHDKIELTILMSMLLVLMPATYYAEASFLMGAFVAGLTFCSSHTLHHIFVGQFKRLLQWLMRIFFAASIGFQVPVKQFVNGEVIWKGLFFTIALTGKLGAGFMVPNFTMAKRFRDVHLRDCLITGFSLAAEGEFAFVIAVFAVDAGLIDTKTYSSIVLAVLLSTIIPPFLLRYTIQKYNNRAQEAVRQAAELEMFRNHDLESQLSQVESQHEMTKTQRNETLVSDIKNKTVIFLCIQTQSQSRWGLLPDIMAKTKKLRLEIIDHRSWHPRGVHTTLVNEIYAKARLDVSGNGANQKFEEKRAEVQLGIEEAIKLEDSKVKVTRWFPGVINEIVEEIEEKTVTKETQRRASIEDVLLKEAQMALESKRSLQTGATQEKSVKDLAEELALPDSIGAAQAEVGAGPERQPRQRRVRQKMRSTPVFGGSLFGEENAGSATTVNKEQKETNKRDVFAGLNTWRRGLGSTGRSAEIIIGGESFQIHVSDETVKNLRKGYNGETTVNGRGMIVQGLSIDQNNAPVVNMLQGYVRNQQLTNIQEERHHDVDSEADSSQHL